MIEQIKKHIETRNKLSEQQFKIYKPLVEEIIISKTKDVNQISLTLDYLLDYCFDNNILLLYRRLCSYLYDIDKQATASYVKAYREMWDEEGEIILGIRKIMVIQ